LPANREVRVIAARVVCTALGYCDGPNLMGDAFFTARLNSLIDAGRIEARGPRTMLRDYSARLTDRRARAAISNGGSRRI
jgi:hypothetical protein